MTVFLVTILAHSSFALAGAELKCPDDSIINRRVATLMDFNRIEVWPADSDPTVRLMNSGDPCWAPERFGWSRQDVALVTEVRRNIQLLKQLQELSHGTSGEDPQLALRAIKATYPHLDWTQKPFQQWLNSSQARWDMIAQLNQPESCQFKRVEVGPVREQWNPWCLGMVAADMVGNVTGQFLSASDLALQINLNLGNFDIIPELPVPQPLFHGALGQRLKPALDVALNGLCLEENFRSDTVVSGRHSSQILRNYFEQAPLGVISNSLLYEMRMVFPGVKDDRYFTAPYTPMSIVAVANQSCGIRIKASGFEAIEKKNNEFKDEHEAVSLIDSILNSGQIIGAALTADTIDSGKGISSLNGHAVSIVGKRFGPNSKKCEYLVRSSWGKSWEDGGFKVPWA